MLHIDEIQCYFGRQIAEIQPIMKARADQFLAEWRDQLGCKPLVTNVSSKDPIVLPEQVSRRWVRAPVDRRGDADPQAA